MKKIIQKVVLWLFLFYSLQHLIRDILADVFGIHNAFTEFLHRPTSEAGWCQGFCQWSTFPVEIFYLVSSVYLLKKKKFGLLGWLMLLLLVPILLQYFNLIIK